MCTKITKTKRKLSGNNTKKNSEYWVQGKVIEIISVHTNKLTNTEACKNCSERREL